MLLTMRLQEFDYDLPPELIAKFPLPQRESGRLLLVDRRNGRVADAAFVDFPKLLRGDELLVFNNTRVIPARLFGRRIVDALPDGTSDRRHAPSGRIEVLLSRETAPGVWETLAQPGKKLQVGAQIAFGDGELIGKILEHGEFGRRVMAFESKDGLPVAQHFERLGHMPLPPYIDREDELADRERYQTVFAKRPGAVAAPTAGLHFSEAILQGIRERGIETCELTLNVGLGTFQPIRSATLEEHTMHAESYDIPVETAERIRLTRAAKRPILAVGTTVVRALEAAALRCVPGDAQRQGELLEGGPGEAELFIYPGFTFRVVDALLTNFHLPRSTLLALVSAFAGRENILRAYAHAVKSGYRFYSYGDCMLVR